MGSQSVTTWAKRLTTSVVSVPSKSLKKICGGRSRQNDSHRALAANRALELLGKELAMLQTSALVGDPEKKASVLTAMDDFRKTAGIGKSECSACGRSGKTPSKTSA